MAKMEKGFVKLKQTEALSRYFHKLPHGQDITLVILKGHLLVEEQINEVINAKLINSDALKPSRLEFFQRICLAEALYPSDVNPILWKAVIKLNKIRNDIAHNLTPTGLDNRLKDFVKFFPSGMDEDTDCIQDRFEKSLICLFIMLASLVGEKFDSIY